MLRKLFASAATVLLLVSLSTSVHARNLLIMVGSPTAASRLIEIGFTMALSCDKEREVIRVKTFVARHEHVMDVSPGDVFVIALPEARGTKDRGLGVPWRATLNRIDDNCIGHATVAPDPTKVQSAEQ